MIERVDSSRSKPKEAKIRQKDVPARVRQSKRLGRCEIHTLKCFTTGDLDLARGIRLVGLVLFQFAAVAGVVAWYRLEVLDRGIRFERPELTGNSLSGVRRICD